MFFLYRLYLRLYHLHSSLRDEHLLLRDEESETDDESDGDDGSTEAVSWEEESESDEEIVYWIIEESPEKEPESSRMTDTQRHFRSIGSVDLCIGKSQRDLWYIRKALLELEYIFFCMAKKWSRCLRDYRDVSAKCFRESCFLDTICCHSDITTGIHDDISFCFIDERDDRCRGERVSPCI